jgi:hypothetical protein
MKLHFALNRNIRRTEIPTKKCFSLYFRKNIAWLHVGLLRICQVFILSAVKLFIGGCDKFLFHKRYIDKKRKHLK